MDALEFLKERKRMCNCYDECYDCPLKNTVCTDIETALDEDFKRAIDTVEQWSKEHPRKTRQSVFLKQWPEAAIDSYGVLDTGSTPISKSHRNKYGSCPHVGVNCYDCRREFWMKEVDE